MDENLLQPDKRQTVLGRNNIQNGYNPFFKHKLHIMLYLLLMI
jgi:hypothetical protein